ncbi:MAG TPA: ATP-binding protein, partial [Burkholderiales bacterium]|nr:ATP-binding protein [Burkholderiales bacterium]
MSVTRRLVFLVVAVLMSALAAAVWGISRAQDYQRAAAEEGLQQLARVLAAVVEQELASRAAVLQTLSRSPSLQRGDLKLFYEYARSIAPSFERTIVLADASGRQLLNTRVPFGEPLPVSDRLPKLRAQLELPAAAVLVSDLYLAPVGKQYSFAVQVPVPRAGKDRLFLAMGSFASTLQRLLEDPRLGKGWNASITDREGTVVARRLEPERFVGRRATPDFLERVRASREGLFETVRLDGVPTVTAFTAIGGSGWTLVIGIPRAELAAPFWRALGAASAAALALIALAVVIAALMGRGIAAAHEAALAQIRAASRDLELKVQAAVADSQRAQEALAQNRRLEALGRLTGGIAHDFNNLLQTMSVANEIVLRGARDPAMVAAAEAGKRAAENAVKLTRQLMTFGRAQEAAREAIDLRDQAMKLQELIARALRGDIELGFDFAGDLWPVQVDPVQLELALLNAALNARDAMPRGGRVVIAGRNVTLAEGEQPGLTGGEYVRLDVTDNGDGIAADLLPRVFEPFFTTKDVGKGSGLGLAQLYGFATQSGGTAAIASEEGRGTTLSIWLPRHRGPAARLGGEAVE